MSFWGWLTGEDHYRNIDRKLDRIMADLSTLQAAASQISTDVNEAIVALNDLAAQVAAGSSVTQADIDAITSQLTSASTALDDAVAADNPPVDPPADPPTDPSDPPVE